MKAVLVMDMPDCCDECPIMFRSEEERCCMVERRNSFTKKPSWCPLKLMPEKVEISNNKELCDAMDWYDLGTKRGYNACIDKIIGE